MDYYNEYIENKIKYIKLKGGVGDPPYNKQHNIDILKWKEQLIKFVDKLIDYINMENFEKEKFLSYFKKNIRVKENNSQQQEIFFTLYDSTYRIHFSFKPKDKRESKNTKHLSTHELRIPNIDLIPTNIDCIIARIRAIYTIQNPRLSPLKSPILSPLKSPILSPLKSPILSPHKSPPINLPILQYNELSYLLIGYYLNINMDYDTIENYLHSNNKTLLFESNSFYTLIISIMELIYILKMQDNTENSIELPSAQLQFNESLEETEETEKTKKIPNSWDSQQDI